MAKSGQQSRSVSLPLLLSHSLSQGVPGWRGRGVPAGWRKGSLNGYRGVSRRRSLPPHRSWNVAELETAVGSLTRPLGTTVGPKSLVCRGWHTASSPAPAFTLRYKPHVPRTERRNVRGATELRCCRQGSVHSPAAAREDGGRAFHRAGGTEPDARVPPAAAAPACGHEGSRSCGAQRLCGASCQQSSAGLWVSSTVSLILIYRKRQQAGALLTGCPGC